MCINSRARDILSRRHSCILSAPYVVEGERIPVLLPHILKASAAYTASKYGLLGFSRVLAEEMRSHGERFDVRLREANSIQVRDKLELAGGEPSPCYVLEAETPHGHYTIWLDPADGFQMAKGILLRRPGHQRGEQYTLTAGERDLSTVDKVRFAKADGVWVPVEASWGLDNTFATAGSNSSRGQLKVTKFLLNPDHAALLSFGVDDIRDGALPALGERCSAWRRDTQARRSRCACRADDADVTE